MRFLPRLICRLICQLSCLALMMAALDSQAQTTYRWVDQSGKVHYSDQPPPPSESKNLQRKKLKAGSVIETGGPSYPMFVDHLKNFLIIKQMQRASLASGTTFALRWGQEISF